MDLELKNKTALVTGGCKGIGKAIVDILTEEGVEVQSICRHTGFDALDVTSFPHIKKVNIVINNVGGGGRWSPIDWIDVFIKNVCPVDYYAEYALERVITISSIFGKEAGLNPHFTAAKAYQIAWMKEQARAHQNERITFNTICPGPIRVGKENDEYPYYGEPKDVANLVAFLCSDKASHINGACITVDGGYSRSF